MGVPLMVVGQSCQGDDGRRVWVLADGEMLMGAEGTGEPFGCGEQLVAKISPGDLRVGFLRWRRLSAVGVAIGLCLWARFVDKAGKGGTDGQVVDLAKRVQADASGPVDDN